MSTIHFVGVAGSGMSALAQFHAMGKGRATGSDRTFDQGGSAQLAERLKAQGIVLYPQDGSGINAKTNEVVISTAVEDSIADIKKAKKLAIPILHRADLLARYVSEKKTIAVAGTSGKSTVVAMIYEILTAAGLSPSVITGGALIYLEQKGLIGNAFRGKSDLLIIEADESDGSLTRYKPWLGVLLNISKDHKDIAELQSMFSTFLSKSTMQLVNADVAEFETLQNDGSTFGIGAGNIKAHDIKLGPSDSQFTVSGVPFRLPLPGKHNVENAIAAIAASVKVGVALEIAARALDIYHGVSRRFEFIGSHKGVQVIDDFAHNPVKVAATLQTAQLRSRRVHCVFQLHGFFPASFMRQEFIDVFLKGLRPDDVLWMPEIYYAGGTTSKSISAKDFVDAISAKGKSAHFFEDRAAMIPELVRSTKHGDLILVMGARDPSLPEFARNIFAALQSK